MEIRKVVSLMWLKIYVVPHALDTLLYLIKVFKLGKQYTFSYLTRGLKRIFASNQNKNLNKISCHLESIQKKADNAKKISRNITYKLQFFKFLKLFN